MDKENDSKIVEACFPQLDNLEVKKILAVSAMLEKKYRNPNIARDGLIIDTYLAIKTGRRVFKGKTDYFEFIMRSMRSIANNQINKADNNNLNDNDIEHVPCDLDTPEESGIKEDEIKFILNLFSNEKNLLELVKRCLVEGITGIKEISNRMNITENQAKYLRNKMIESIVKANKNNDDHDT